MIKRSFTNNKNNAEEGAALYLVVVFTSMAVSLLCILYSTLSAAAINSIESAHDIQEVLYLESGAEMLRAGMSPDEVYLEFLTADWGNVTIDIIESDLEKYYSIYLEDSDLILSFYLNEGKYYQYSIKERSIDDEAI